MTWAWWKRLGLAVGVLPITVLLAACAGAPPATEPSDSGAESAASVDQAAVDKIDTSKHAIFYAQLWKLSDEGPLIPGLDEGHIPQGIAYWKDKDWLIISSYNDSNKPSTLSVVDASSGQEVKTVSLLKPDGGAYTGHAGGVAISQNHLWVSSDGKAWWMPLESLEQADHGDRVRFDGVVETVARASFTTYHDGILWVGEFHLEPNYTTDASHKLTSPDGSRYSAWAAGYRLDAEDRIVESASGPAIPSYILSIPDSVQGMTFTDDTVITSQSYGRGNDSRLTMYRRPDLNGEPQQRVTVGGQEVPVWFLDSTNRTQNLNPIIAPPMSEGVDTDGNRLFLLFESGAQKYRSSAASPMDTIRVIRLDEWMNTGQ